MQVSAYKNSKIKAQFLETVVSASSAIRTTKKQRKPGNLILIKVVVSSFRLAKQKEAKKASKQVSKNQSTMDQFLPNSFPE